MGGMSASTARVLGIEETIWTTINHASGVAGLVRYTYQHIRRWDNMFYEFLVGFAIMFGGATVLSGFVASVLLMIEHRSKKVNVLGWVLLVAFSVAILSPILISVGRSVLR